MAMIRVRGMAAWALATLALGLGWSRAGEPVVHPASCYDRTLGDQSWLDAIGSCVKQPENPTDVCTEQCLPAYGCAPYCIQDILLELIDIDLGNCPTALPAPGKPIALAMVSGLAVPHAGWEMDVGFGPGRPLNYLSRLYVAPNGRSAKVFLPAAQRSADFAFVAGGEFELADGGMSLPGGTRVAVADATAELRFSHGRLWRYEAAGEFRGGRVFRVAEMRDRQGRSDRVAYGENTVTLTDTAGHPYVVRFDPQTRRIGRIDVLDRAWRYEYSADPETNAATVAEIAPDGSVARVTVNAKGRVTFKGQTAPDGLARSMALEYDAEGRITLAREGSVAIPVEESLNDQGRVVRTLNAGPVVWRAVFDGERLAGRADGADGRATRNTTPATRFDFAEQTDALGRVWKKNHDAAGRLLSSKAPDGRETRYVYDERGNAIERITPEGRFRFEYDANNHVVRETIPSGAVLTFVRDTEGRIVEQTDALGNITKYTYNDMGQAVSQTGPFGPGEKEPPARRLEYDAWGNMTASFDELGNAMKFEYDLANNLTKIIDASGNVTRYFYDGLNQKVKEIDALGGTTEWIYDDRGLVVEVKGSQTGVSGPMAGKTTCASCGGAAGTFDQPGKYEYNAARLLTKFTDVLGHETKYDYNDLGQQVKVIDALGAETQFEYDLIGNLQSVTDPLGAVTRHRYDNFGRQVAIIDPLGRATRFEYDVEGRLTAEISPGGAVTRREYDARGRLAKMIAPSGAATTYGYNPAGQLIRTVNALGVATEYFHNGNNSLVERVVDAEGKRVVTKNVFNPSGRLTSTTNTLGLVRQFEYDSSRRLAQSTSPMGFTAKYEYDALNRRVRTIDPTGRAMTTEYAPGSNEVSAIALNGVFTEWYTYDALGRRTSVAGLDRPSVSYRHDAIGRIVEIQSEGRTIRNAYDAAGRLTESIDAMGAVTRYEYDPAGQLMAVTNPLGAKTRYDYDLDGRLAKTTFSGGSIIEHAYNQAGLLIETRGGPEGTLKYEYDVLGRQTAVVDANGRRNQAEYDALGRVIRRTDELGRSIQYEYNDLGWRVGMVDANGRRTAWEYDDDGMPKAMVYPNGDREEYRFDGAGNLVEQRTANGEMIRYSYNAAGSLERIDVDGGDAPVLGMYEQLRRRAAAAGVQVDAEAAEIREFSIAIARDGQQRVVSVEDPLTTLRYAYDRHGWLTGVTDTALKTTVHYEYDQEGHRTRMAFEKPDDPNGEHLRSVLYQYDAVGRLLSTGREGEAPAVFAYDADGRRTRLTQPNGVVVAYTHDEAGRLTGLSVHGPRRYTEAEAQAQDGRFEAASGRLLDAAGRVQGAGEGDLLARYAYTLDRTGRATSLVLENGDVVQYETDAAYQLARETRKNGAGEVVYDRSYEYDAMGNRLRGIVDGERREYVYNPANQLVSEKRITDIPPGPKEWVEKRFTYDANGNRVYMEILSADQAVVGAELFVYDPLDRLISMGFPAESVSMRYRGLGYEPWSSTRTSADGVIATHFVLDGHDVALELDDGKAARAFLTPALDHILSLTDLTDGRTRFYARDRLGSLLLATDESGIRTSRTDYTAFGDPLAEGGALETDGFAGRLGSVNGYRNFRTRWYGDGRWLSRDWMGYEGGANLYQYVKNDPVSLNDPFGLWGRNIHYNETYELAVLAAYQCPEVIANWDQSVDEDETSPSHFIPNWRNMFIGGIMRILRLSLGTDRAISDWARNVQKHHFPVGEDGIVEGGSEASQWLVNEGLSQCNIFQFSRGLHVFQDSYSHSGTPFLRGYMGHGRGRFGRRGIARLLNAMSGSADNPNAQPDTVIAMGMEVYALLQAFASKCKCECPRSSKIADYPNREQTLGIKFETLDSGKTPKTETEVRRLLTEKWEPQP